LEPILLPVWAYFTRGEVPAWWTVTGAAVILLGLFLSYVWHQARRRTLSEVAQAG
jgi:drug/metabolite transporter (DMT)-like permease